MSLSRLPARERLRVPASLLAAVAGFGLITASAHAQTNLLQNGSFESSYFDDATATSQGIGYVSPPPNAGSGRATVPGWSWTASPNAGSGSYSSTFALNITGGNLRETAQDGQYAVSFGTGSYCSGGSIRQSFAVTSGAHCTLSFWVLRIGGGEGIGAQVKVTDDSNGGAQVALVDGAGNSYASGYTVPMPASAGVWQQTVLKFTASSSQLTFTFTDTTPGTVAGSTDLGLDNVSITQKTLQTFTVLGGSGNPGDVAANTEWSNDGDVTWHPAYLYGSHPWGCINGTNSWINQIASGTGAGLYQTTDYRIRFNLPSDFETQSATFQIDADDRAVMVMNGNAMPTQFGTNPASSVPVRTISASDLLPGQVNTIKIALTDLYGGWVGINYRVDLTGYSASTPTVVVLPPVITSALSATGTVGVPFSYTLTGGNNPAQFGAANLPAGLSINASTGVISGTPTAAGTYACAISETNSGGTTTATLTITINKGAAQVTLGGLAQVYDGTTKSATATTQPADLVVAFSYTGAALPPVNAGSYGVFASIADPAYTGSASGTLVISPAAATITFGNTVQSYDGTPKAVTTSTTPAGVAVSVTYNGSATAPSAVGNYTVAATVTDKNYTGSATTNLQIQDTTPPVITTPANLVLEATGAQGAVATFSVTATDNVDGTVAVVTTPASGSTFPLGTTTVTATSHDAAGNTANASFTVTVRDTTAPVITAPASITAEATGPAGAVVTFAASATDLVDGATAVHATPASASVFAIGVTTVTLSSTDAHGNTATKAFTVTVRDTTPPVLTLPANQVLEATSAAGAVANFAATATDLVTANPTIAYTMASGSTFPIGVTTVTVTATDAAGNPATGAFTITVRDTTPPVLTMPANLVLEATSAAGAVATYSASATDLVTANPTITYSIPSGASFPLGTTAVAVTATDAAGNAVTKSFSVTVRDTTAPTIGSVTASPNTIWPPNKKMVPVTITVGASDNVGVASQKIVSVATNEPDANVQWQITGPLTLNLLADRLGTGTGRIYTITVEVRDGAGNASQKTVTVAVPHDQR